MDEELRAEFTHAMMRLKKLRGFWSNAIELNMSEAIILRTIGHGATLPDARARMALIHNKFHISKPAISQNLTSLEEKGLITRSINQSDRRRFDFNLTEAGVAAAERMDVYANERMATMLSLMGEDDARSFIRLLNKLGDIIESMTQENMEDIAGATAAGAACTATAGAACTVMATPVDSADHRGITGVVGAMNATALDTVGADDPKAAGADGNFADRSGFAC
jgi:DNA-binding MarR family transcriptional regulator